MFTDVNNKLDEIWVFAATLISQSTVKIPFQGFSLINFPIPCDLQQLSSLLKATVERKRRNLNENRRRRTIQNVCLVTRQSFNEGSLNTRTWKRLLSQVLIKPSIGEKLVAKREFNNPMDKHAVKAVKGDETVSHLPCMFSRIAWYFLARGGEISVKEVDR